MKHDKVKSPARPELKILIANIGGETALFSILEDFYARMSADLLIGFFFTGRDLKHISKMQGNFILMAAGLHDSYEGKGPSTAHTALAPILSGHFDRRLVILRETLKDHQINSTDADAWLRFEESFRAIVVAD